MTKDEINALRVGDRLHDDGGEFRIMAMADTIWEFAYPYQTGLR